MGTQSLGEPGTLVAPQCGQRATVGENWAALGGSVLWVPTGPQSWGPRRLAATEGGEWMALSRPESEEPEPMG